MDEFKPNSVPPNSDADDDATRIPINVQSGDSSGPASDHDGIVPPAPGQVVQADAGTVPEASLPEEPVAPADPTPATDQPAPVVIQPGQSVNEGPVAADSQTPPASATPTITPAGLPSLSAPQPTQQPVLQQPVDTAAAAPQVVTSNRGGKGRLIKAFLLLVIIALLAVGGYFAYQKNHKAAKVAAPATAAVKDIPLLKVGVNQASFTGIYPAMTDTSNSVLVNSQLFDGLVRFEDKNQIAPDLASSWTNPDATTWLFTIKDGVKFHDGHTLTAADVKSSLESLIASKSAFAQTFTSTIASVDVTGSNQVKITTTTPDPALLNKLTYVYIVDPTLPAGAEPSQAGTGPYEIKPGTTPSDADVQMVAFDSYHDGRPTTRALEFGSTDQASTLITDYKAGKFNIVGPLTPADMKSLKTGTTQTTDSSDISFVGFNTAQAGPLQTKLVREAVRYAVDAGAIGAADNQSVTPDSQLLPPSIAGYDTKIAPYKQDVDKAKQLLAQAGYQNGLTVKFSTADSAAKLAELTDELKQAGITLTVDQHADPHELASFIAAGKAEMYDTAYSSATMDGLSYFTAALPATNYSTTAFNDAVSKASATTKPADQTKLLQTIATTVDGDVAAVPLYSTNTLWLTDQQYNLKQQLLGAGPSVYFYQVHQ